MTSFLIGVDSVDSDYGGCTTHFTLFLVKELLRRGYSLASPPFLVRLNPAFPNKTRGNAAVALSFRGDARTGIESAELIEHIWSLAMEYVSPKGGTVNRGSLPKSGPGLAVFVKEDGDGGAVDNVVKFLRKVYEKAVVDMVSVEWVTEKANSFGHLSLKGGLGTVGALASLGFILLDSRPVTYELIAYRVGDRWGTSRSIDDNSFVEIVSEYSPPLFNNVDKDRKRPIATPHGPDPVLLGLRSTDACMLLDAGVKVAARSVLEPIFSWMLFVTNQHTDAFLKQLREPGLIRPYQAGLLRGVVSSTPIVNRGGHVFFEVSGRWGSTRVAVFKPSGSLRDFSLHLMRGDLVEVAGVAKPTGGSGIIFEAYKLRLVEAPRRVRVLNPLCPQCGSRVKSGGKRAFKCPRCRKTLERKEAIYEIRLGTRTITHGTWITPEEGRISHLTMPAGVRPQILKGLGLECSWEERLRKLLETTVFNPLMQLNIRRDSLAKGRLPWEK